MSKSWLEMLKKSAHEEKTNHGDSAGWLKMLKRLTEQREIAEEHPKRFADKIQRYLEIIRFCLNGQNVFIALLMFGLANILLDVFYFGEAGAIWEKYGGFPWDANFETWSPSRYEFLNVCIFLLIGLVAIICVTVYSVSYLYAGFAILAAIWLLLSEIWKRISFR